MAILQQRPAAFWAALGGLLPAGGGY